MPKFADKSLERLESCDTRLEKLMDRVIKCFDFTVLYGYRDKKEQNKAFENGYSTKEYPHSKHNKYPSTAIDVAPYPIDWNDRERFTYLAGMIKGIAFEMGMVFYNSRFSYPFEYQTSYSYADKLHRKCHRPHGE